jgi:acyl-CoA thioesterase-1
MAADRPALRLSTALFLWWAFRIAQEVRGGFVGRTYWLQPQGDEGGLLYVALGDSVAQGVGASRPERGYVGLIAARLHAETGEPVRILNLSRTGARIRDVLSAQLPALEALHVHPDIVTIDIGGNDMSGYNATRFARDADELTKALPSGTFIADVPYFMHGHWERDALEAAGVLSRSAQRNELIVVPLHAALRDEGWRAMLTQFAPDWFHPNDRGHRIWARVFWSTMTEGRELPTRDPGLHYHRVDDLR